MGKYKTFIKAIFAGILINIAATIYLLTPNKIIGSLLFSFGLLVILLTQSNLYTGMAGYYPIKTIPTLLLVLLGNILGCGIYSGFYSLTSNYKNIQSLAYQLCENKFAAEPISIFIMSILCGSLMFIGVDTYKKNPNIIGIIIVILCVSGFILAGFEHSIANMSYLCLANYKPSIMVYIKFAIMVVGNFIGAVFTRLIIEL